MTIQAIQETVAIPAESDHDGEQIHGTITVPTGEVWYLDKVLWGVSNINLSTSDDEYRAFVTAEEPTSGVGCETGEWRFSSSSVNRDGATIHCGFYVYGGQTINIGDDWSPWDSTTDSHDGGTARLLGRRVL